MINWTEEDLNDLLQRRKDMARRYRETGNSDIPAAPHEVGIRRKYGNVRTEYDGKMFDSKHQAEVYRDLCLLRRGGEVKVIMRQVPFDLPGGIKYIADFVVYDKQMNIHVIDAKSEITKKNQVYINKKKQMLSEWGIEVEEY